MSFKTHTLKYNAFMNMILTSSSAIFPLITVPYVSRILTPMGVGAVSLCQSIVSYFSLIALLGISTYGVRACAQVRNQPDELARVVEELILILVISTSIMYSLYIGAIFFIQRFSEDKFLFLLFGLNLWLASFGVEWFYQALEQYDYIAIRSIVVKLIGLILLFTFVRSTDDYYAYGAIVIFTGYGSNILNIIRLHRLIHFRPLRELNILRHLQPMKSFFISSVSSGMYTQVDIVALGILTSNSVLGVYQLVAKIKNLLLMAINSFVNVMLPRLSFYAVNKHDEYRQLLVRNLNIVILFSFAGISVTALNAEYVIDFLGGKQYSTAVIPLLCILPALLFVSINTVLSQFLISSGREKQYAKVNFAGLVSSILYSLILIPLLGAVGAALSCSLCEFSALIFRCWYSRDFIHSVFRFVEYWKAPVGAAVSFFATFFLVSILNIDFDILHIFVSCFIFLFFYILCLYVVHENIIRSCVSKILFRNNSGNA